MSNIAVPNSFSPNAVIQSSQVNANWAEVQNKFNTYAVQTDTAKTITVTHTFSANQSFTGGITVTNAITMLTASSQIVPGTASFSIRNNANNADNLLVADSGSVLVRNGVTIAAGGITTTGVVSFANVTTLTPIFNTTTGAVSDVVQLIFQRGGVNKWRIGNNVSGANDDAFSVYHETFFNVLSVVQSTGVVTAAKGLIVGAGGVTVTGNSTITGNLNVTGTITAVTGGNSYVRRTSDLNYTSGTDLTLTFAIGAAEEWEFEYHLVSTNASAATMSFTVAGPASCTGHFAGLGTTNNNTTAIVGDAEVVFGNAMSTFNMNATACWAHIRGYVKGGGTPGNVTIAGTASAGTGVLKSGSFVRFSRIA